MKIYNFFDFLCEGLKVPEMLDFLKTMEKFPRTRKISKNSKLFTFVFKMENAEKLVKKLAEKIRNAGFQIFKVQI